MINCDSYLIKKIIFEDPIFQRTALDLFEIYETPNGLHHHFIDAGKPGSFGSELIEMIKTYEIEWQTMNQMKIIQSLWE